MVKDQLAALGKIMFLPKRPKTRANLEIVGS